MYTLSTIFFILSKSVVMEKWVQEWSYQIECKYKHKHRNFTSHQRISVFNFCKPYNIENCRLLFPTPFVRRLYSYMPPPRTRARAQGGQLRYTTVPTFKSDRRLLCVQLEPPPPQANTWPQQQGVPKRNCTNVGYTLPSRTCSTDI